MGEGQEWQGQDPCGPLTLWGGAVQRGPEWGLSNVKPNARAPFA